MTLETVDTDTPVTLAISFNLAVLLDDPTAVAPTSIQDIQVQATVVDGRFVFEREGTTLTGADER